ncbi:hypothetical protein CSOJ01_05584 [Colletotrichum sojae]|uniref:Uncharacterized protein n=1 Tax=Colletotrichum sojae TaxID=2175907 RepID=A0A8H6MWM6_9PEZI|nr:hypothetical protein CSOJ01_05584 [Colletotrichum sojae]
MAADDIINKKRPISPDGGNKDSENNGITNKKQRTISPAPKPPPEALGSEDSDVPRGPAVIWTAFLSILNIENPTSDGAPKTPVDVLATLLEETFLNYLTIERSQGMVFRFNEKGDKVHIPLHDGYIPAPLNQQGSILIGQQDRTRIFEESQWQHKPDEPIATLVEMERQGFLPDAPRDTWSRVMSGGLENVFKLQPFDITFPLDLNLPYYLHHGPFWRVHDSYIDTALNVKHIIVSQPDEQPVIRVQLSPGRLPTVRNMQA